MMRWHHTPIRTAKVKIVKIVTVQNAGEDAEELDLTHITGENVTWYSHSGKQFSFLRK